MEETQLGEEHRIYERKKGNVATEGKEDAKGVADAELCDRRPVSCVDQAMTGNPRLR